ncbi:hypothetical protein KOAAANKH_00698 [Brevundimonas sp. NIBR10]|nr:hypothetical protein KOAAANKH_00698 [Brevundimonas sp. NIBR10]
MPVLASRLSRAFEARASAYKFFWFLSLLNLIDDHEDPAEDDVIAEMVVLAWAPSALYRLSFGVLDRLQDVILDLQAWSALPGAASPARVRAVLKAWPEGRSRLDALARYVPSRFLAPWLLEALAPSMREDLRTQAIVAIAADSIGLGAGPPYALKREGRRTRVVMDPVWRAYLRDQRSMIEVFAQMKLAAFLQSRNPHTPAIVNKLGPPNPRNLRAQRAAFEVLALSEPLHDLYSGERLAAFALDHVLPRSFLAHDLIWNLAPVTAATNSSKGDSLPDLTDINALAGLHHRLMTILGPEGRLLESYSLAFGRDVAAVRGLPLVELEGLYRAHYAPLLQIAANQGFAPWQRTGV